MKKIILSIMVLASMAFGSASVFKGTTQDMSFRSSPEGAKVYIDGQLKGTTPLVVKLAKNKYNTVTFEKKGYKRETMALTKSFDGGMFALDIIWDLGTTDFISGAIYEYDQNAYQIELEKK
jgi:hypothetical protein